MKVVMPKKKSFNTELDNLLAGLDLPSDEEVREETGKLKRAEGLQNPKVREKIGKTLKASAKYKEAIKNRDQSYKQSAEYKNARKEAMEDYWSNPDNKKKHKEALKALKDDPVRLAEYQKNYNKGNSKKYDNPEYWENYYAGIAKRDADKEYTKKRLDASRAKICKKVHTPLGVFNSITEASKAYGMSNSETMRHRIKSSNFPDFYIVE